MRRVRPPPFAADEYMEKELLAARRAVYEYQRVRIEAGYGEYEDIADVREFFFDMVYTDPSLAAKFAKRDATFERIARSRLFRLLTSKEMKEYLKNIIALKSETERLDTAVARALLTDGGVSPVRGSGLPEERYNAAYRAVSTKKERLAQLESVLNAYDLCYHVMYDLPIGLDDILRLTPRIFLRNSDLLNLCVTAWRVFSRHKPRLLEYGEIIRARETERIERIFHGATP